MSTATIKQYTKPLRKWWSFCQSSSVPLWSPSPTQFLRFLSQELHEANSYSSLNNTRSAISLISVNEIGNHSLTKRFCKGVGVLKPPRPRYDFVWDPAPVLEKLANIYPHETLPLNIISKKLVLLLALATGQRVQTLSLFRVSQISFDEKLIIRIPDRIKTSAVGRSQPFFCFSPFISNKSLCIFNLMKTYLNITRDLRQPSCDNFFISWTKPHRAVSQQTISRWIRSSLEECGINSNVFSSHSTRHASTSLAARKGVAVDLIKRAAGWSGQSRVFAKFYNRPLVNPEEFSNSVLGC